MLGLASVDFNKVKMHRTVCGKCHSKSSNDLHFESQTVSLLHLKILIAAPLHGEDLIPAV